MKRTARPVPPDFSRRQRARPNPRATKKAFSVANPGGSATACHLITINADRSPKHIAKLVLKNGSPPEYGCFTYRSPSIVNDIPKIHRGAVQALRQYVVLDTAFQKSCCSSRWIEQHYQALGAPMLHNMCQDKSSVSNAARGPRAI